MASSQEPDRTQALRIALTRLAIVDGSAWKVFAKHECTYAWLANTLKVSDGAVVGWFDRFVTPHPGVTLKIAGLMEALEEHGYPLAGHHT